MRAKIKPVSPEVRLERILAALEQELLDTTDIEIREAAQELGMNLDMKGSAAFLGLRYPAKASLADFFGSDALERLREIVEARRGDRDGKGVLPHGEEKDDSGQKS